MAKGENFTSRAVSDSPDVPIEELPPLPTRAEIRNTVKKLMMRASDFEMGGMTEMATFDRLAAAQLNRLLREIEMYHHPSMGDVNRHIREELFEPTHQRPRRGYSDDGYDRVNLPGDFIEPPGSDNMFNPPRDSNADNE